MKNKMTRLASTVLAPITLGASLLAFGLPAAQAQDVTLPTRGSLLPTKNTREISIAGLLQFNNGSPYSLQLGYGLFTSPTVEVGAVGTVAGANHAKAASSIGGFADYYFRGSNAIEGDTQFLPYAGVFAGVADSGSNSSTSLGAQVGGKYFFNPNVALTGELRYRTVDHSSGNTTFLLGLATFFR